MSATFTAAEHAAAALRRVGTYAPSDAGADPDEVQVALLCLDKLIGELAGTERCWWLIPGDITVPLTAGINPTDIVTAAGLSVIGAHALQFITQTKLINTTATPAQERPLTRLSRLEYSQIDSPFRAALAEAVYIDRTLQRPMAYLDAVPPTGNVWSLLLTVQEYHPDVSKNKNQMAIDAAWNRWIEYALAADIGSGPVLNLDGQRINGYRLEAERTKQRLLAFQNRESVRRPFTVFNDF